MKKRILIPLAIALALLISVFAVVAMASTTPTLKITGANLEFGERVHIMYAVDSEGISDKENIELLIFRGDVNVASCVKGKEVAALSTTGREINENGVSGIEFKYTEIAAAEATENIYACAYYNDGTNEYYSPVVKYSVIQYAMNKLGYTSNNPTTDTKLIAMINNMRLYSASAQEYFGVNLDRLATDEFVKVSFDGATLADGMTSGLFAKGEKVEVTASKVDASNPYAVWSGADGATVATGETVTITATKNTTVSAVAQATEPSFGSYKHVVIVGVDGAGSFYPDETDTPNIDSIFANGALTRTMRVTSPSASGPSWMSCLHGVLPENHGLKENLTVESEGAYTMDSNYPSILRVVKEAMPESEVGAIYAWIGINGIVEREAGITKRNLSDEALVKHLEAGYVANEQPALLYVHLNGPDGVGHRVGHHTPEYYASIEQADAYIGRIYDAYAAAGILEDTLFIVTSDHGGVNQTHGGLKDTEKYSMFAVAGKNVKNGAIGDMYIRDTASVALHALGVAQPDTYTSIVPNNVFADVSNVARKEYHDPDSPRYHIPEQTPAMSSDKFVTSVVNKQLVTYLPFDGNTTEAFGATVTENGKITYEDGYFGQGVQLEDGHLNVYTDFAPGTGSFTISTWVKAATPTNGHSPMISSKVWGDATAGFAFATGRDTKNGPEHFTNFTIADGTNTASIAKNHMPTDFIYGWMHVTLIVDRDNNLMRMAYDFGDFVTVDIPAAMSGASLNSICDYITLGNDTTGDSWYKSGIAFDELMIFNGALNRADVNAIAAYYGVELETAAEGNVTDALTTKPDVYFNFDNTIINDGNAAASVTKSNTIAFADGKVGSSVYLDATHYLTLGNIELGTGSFSAAMWVNPTDLSFGGGGRYKLPLMSNAAGVGRENFGFNIILDTEYHRLVVTMGETGGGMQEMVDMPVDTYQGKWTHIAVVFNRETGNLVIYLDFVKVLDKKMVYNGSSTAIPADLTADTDYPIRIGNLGNPTTSHSLKAYLDDVMFFTEALTDADVAAIANYHRVPLSSFIDKTPVIDLGFDGSISNKGSYDGAIEEDGTLSYTEGYYGQSAVFKNGSVDLSELKLGNGSFTTAFWVKTPEYYSYGGNYPWYSNIFSTALGSESSNPGIAIVLKRDSKTIYVNTNDGGGNRGYGGASYDGIAVNGEWMHVAVVVNTEPKTGESYVDIYLNFQKVTFSLNNAAAFGYNSFDGAEGFTPHIGQDGTGAFANNYKDMIDEFLLFGDVLTADEITALGAYYGIVPEEAPEYNVSLRDYINAKPAIDIGFNGGTVENDGTHDGVVSEDGTVDYVEGYYGEGATFKNGSVDLEDYKFDSREYTISFWMNFDQFAIDGFYWRNILSTGDDSEGDAKGLSIIHKGDVDDANGVRRGGLLLNFNDGEGNRGYVGVVFPEFVELNSWVHVTIVVDRHTADGTSFIKIYFNFQEVETFTIDHRLSGWENIGYDGADGFTPHIGNDGDGNFAYPYDEKLDEFLIFEDALTAAEVAALGQYYADMVAE